MDRWSGSWIQTVNNPSMKQVNGDCSDWLALSNFRFWKVMHFLMQRNAADSLIHWIENSELCHLYWSIERKFYFFMILLCHTIFLTLNSSRSFVNRLLPCKEFKHFSWQRNISRMKRRTEIALTSFFDPENQISI